MRSAADVLNGRHVAVVGAGLVGAGWAIVFARGGLEVRVFDANAQRAGAVLDFVHAQLAQMRAYGPVDDADAVQARISVSPTLAHAVEAAGCVQESVLERVDVKTALMLQLEGLLIQRPLSAVRHWASPRRASRQAWPWRRGCWWCAL